MNKLKKTMNKNKVSNTLIMIGCLFILFAVLLFLYNTLEDVNSKKENDERLATVKELTKMEKGEAKEEAIEDSEYIGELFFPTLDTSFAICKEWDYDKLKEAPCRYHGFPEQGNFVIAGHNYRSQFGKLFHMAEGDPVSFVSLDGTIYEYEIVSIEILSGSQVEEMISSGYDLSLYTCTYGGRARRTMRCKLINAYK